MTTVQKRTFYGYGDGMALDRLPFGTIVWDYRNPALLKPHIPKGRDEFLDSEDWTSSTPRENCRFRVSLSGRIDLDLGVAGVVGAGANRDVIDGFIVEADKGNRVVIKSERMDEFLEKAIENPEAELWLNNNLSGAFTMAENGKRLFRSPKLWLLTGLYIVSDAAFDANDRGKIGGTIGGKFPPIPFRIGIHLRAGKDDMGSKTTIPGKSVWAAQWLQLKAYPRKIKVENEATAGLKFHIKLTNTYCKGSTRGGPYISYYHLKAEPVESLNSEDLNFKNPDLEEMDVEDQDPDEFVLENSKEEDWIELQKLVDKIADSYAAPG
ncbi:hypothetical protein GP486_005362 [Trichoglossum hirsutum]|uniref:Uncharacterized protein n=1 Tax=Trichoglossum hirsutum TaxID=265104 RepID=A0A9P8RMD2_9PEZI|nr:hypothetical protein GP486_005362 [Trichoglossum hirsutum]